MAVPRPPSALPVRLTAMALGVLGLLQAHAQTPSPTPASAPATAAAFRSSAQRLPGTLDCQQPAIGSLTALNLVNVLDHIICKSPLLGQSLNVVAERQANVDLAENAWRPRVSASAEVAANRIPSSNSGSDSLGASLTGSLSVAWTIYDFGQRHASLRQSQHQLVAAQASRQSTSLAEINTAMQLFVEAAAAQARLEAQVENEQVARKSLDAAQGKYEAQVAALSEMLQARTALAQATLDRVRSEGAWLTARGLLAVAMGFSVEQPLTLASAQNAFPTTSSLNGPLDWIEQSKRQHPRVRAAQADIQSLQARLDAVRAEGKGSVTLSVGAGSTRDLATRGSQFEHRLSGYVVASIPLLNQVDQKSREAQIVAQIEASRATLEQIERDISSDLWRNVKLLESETENLNASKLLLDSARQSYDITFGRYKAGVGSILELLATQAVLSSARSQWTLAQLSQAQARLRLDVVSGQILNAQ